VQRAVDKYGSSVHCIVASGGNAGIATACAAHALGVRCTVYIPIGVADRTLDFLRTQNAEVIVIGKYYAEALRAARDAVAKEEDA
jgi:L-serine/L-threonine ammonia-lyase